MHFVFVFKRSQVGVFVVDSHKESADLVWRRLRGRVACNAFARAVIGAGLRGGGYPDHFGAAVEREWKYIVWR